MKTSPIKVSTSGMRAYITNSTKSVTGGQKFGEEAMRNFREYREKLKNQPSLTDTLDKIIIDLDEGAELRKLLNDTTIPENPIVHEIDKMYTDIVDFGTEFTPEHFTLRVAPKITAKERELGKFDLKSWIGAAREYFENDFSKSFEELNKELPEGFTFKAFADENGKINLVNATAMLLLQSTARLTPKMTKFDPSAVRGIITEAGELSFIENYLDKYSVKNTKNLVQQVVDYFKIDKVVEEINIFKNSK